MGLQMRYSNICGWCDWKDASMGFLGQAIEKLLQTFHDTTGVLHYSNSDGSWFEYQLTPEPEPVASYVEKEAQNVRVGDVVESEDGGKVRVVHHYENMVALLMGPNWMHRAPTDIVLVEDNSSAAEEE